VLESICDFFLKVKAFCFDPTEILKVLSFIVSSIAENGEIRAVVSYIADFAEPLYTALPYIALALLFAFALFGRKLLLPAKFLFFFAVGFFVGVNFIAPLVAASLEIPALICGLAVGFIFATLCKFLYVAVFAVIALYSAYISASFVFSLFGEAQEFFIASFAIAVGAVVAAFVFREYVEILATATLSGFLLSITVKYMIFDFSNLAFFGDGTALPVLALTLLVSALGVSVQLKTRRKNQIA
ncbi:MAG: hypothetical protein J6Q68_01145, partial [Clostridia bacterium]|nr:hypothetical protein [Clostridia bacterium]